ncbi:hypothetical protein [Prosthecobacter sp.]|uniref:hypothetical protein n=1 Tax=Prosthecobacter sp. TaxID=1965333 RepID=UPI002AB85BAE|nr:hypothetical protein [Prosthecobacter sp.]MDZ4402064.1 hypothetical protein [Prosthecobacter sp.]
MNTIPDTTGQAASFQQAASAKNAEARFVTRHLHRVWQFRRMRATFLRPFRQAIRPLLVWLRQEHVFVKSGQFGAPPVGLKLKQFGWETIALTVVLGPLAFIMLLPLLILIFPVAVLIGLAAVIVAAIQTDAEDAEHHTLAWHAMH